MDDVIGGPEVRVLRGTCSEGDTCDKILDVGDPDFLHFVSTPETDEAVLAATARHRGPDEQLHRVPRWLIPEVH